MQIKKILYFIILSFLTPTAFSQVGINTETPQVTLQIQPSRVDATTAEGVICPRLTLDQLIVKNDMYTTDHAGTIVYVSEVSTTVTPKTENVTSPGYYYFDGTLWQSIGGAFGAWNTVGTELLSILNSDDVYVRGKVVVGGDAICALHVDKEAVFTVVDGDAAVHGINVGRGSGGIATNTVFGNNALANNDGSAFNVVIGYEAMKSMQYGHANVALGYQSLLSNEYGWNNTALGYRSLASSTNALDNTAVGYMAGEVLTLGRNTALGSEALAMNNNGSYNVALGYRSLWTDKAGNNNVSIGGDAGTKGINSIINNIVAVGHEAAVGGSTGIAIGATAQVTDSASIAIGSAALADAMGGIAIGHGSMVDENYSIAIGTNCRLTGQNTVAIGANTLSGYSNTVLLGNVYTTTIMSAATSITALSDGRVKKNVSANVPGLAFIRKLNPVTYNIDTEAHNRITGNSDTKIDPQNEQGKLIRTGFIAQDVEKAAQEVGYDFDGVRTPQNHKDIYGLNYASFVVPLVKAVQEQQDEIERLSEMVRTQQEQINALISR